MELSSYILGYFYGCLPEQIGTLPMYKAPRHISHILIETCTVITTNTSNSL